MCEDTWRWQSNNPNGYGTMKRSMLNIIIKYYFSIVCGLLKINLYEESMYILNFIRGFCMALADSVPGVSGGTIAFILGFYDDFVNSLKTVISEIKQIE